MLQIRDKSRKFREWLQSEADRDRDAIIAYHTEVARASGFTNIARKGLKIFGVLGGAAAGAALLGQPAIGAAIGAAGGAAIQAGTEEAVKYLFDLGADLGANWRPVVFGEWYSGKIAKLLAKQASD